MMNRNGGKYSGIFAFMSKGRTSLAGTIITMLPFTPNSDQQSAISAIADFVERSDDRSVFILRGYAGTGKTNLVSGLTRALPAVRWRSVLLAPTGRAAKVLSGYAARPATTIHRKIFRKVQGTQGEIFFAPAENLHKNTLFIVDEASMIGAGTQQENASYNLLESLFEYVYSGENCKLLLCGDTAQLPPVGSPESPALDPEYLKRAYHLHITMCELKEVARQRLESLILYNATNLRILLASEGRNIPQIQCGPDMVNLPGEELEDVIQRSISEYGEENVIIITRSNKRAGLFNQSFRNRIRLFEEDLCTGDRIMIVKNNYFWLPENNGEAGFIANGDMAEIMSITRRETLYGFNFCDCMIRLCDYENLPPQQVRIITDCLYSDAPAMTNEQQQALYGAVLQDVADEPSKAVRSSYTRNSPYYNALQVKFAYAITCHKAQGGQWPVVFIDHGYLKDEMIDESLLRWLYTAVTRATEKVYLVNFSPLLLSS